MIRNNISHRLLYCVYYLLFQAITIILGIHTEVWDDVKFRGKNRNSGDKESSKDRIN